MKTSPLSRNISHIPPINKNNVSIRHYIETNISPNTIPHLNQTVLSGEAWTSIRINIHMENAYLALLANHEYGDVPESSLAKIDFLASRLTFDDFSDGTKDVALVSSKICIHDTRYTGKCN